MHLPSLHVVLVNYNGQAFNADCLASLRDEGVCRLTVWLVDNGSTDGSAEWVERNRPDVRLVRNGANLGWAGGNNVGIRRALQAGADFVWLLNNDTVLEPSCVAKMVASATASDAPALLSPRIHYADNPGRTWFEGGEVDPVALRWGHCPLAHFRSLPQDRRYVSGCALLVRREVFEEAGLIDERYFMYYEDAEFCLRAARLGFAMDVVEEARLAHRVAASSGGASDRLSPFRAYQTLRSEMIFWRRQLGFWDFHRRWCHGHLAKWVNDLPAGWQDEERRPVAEAIMDAVWYHLTCRNAPRGRPPSPAWFRTLMRTRPWLVAQLMGFRLPGSR
jgi:GT2 family glycosyltransferase